MTCSSWRGCTTTAGRGSGGVRTTTSSSTVPWRLISLIMAQQFQGKQTSEFVGWIICQLFKLTHGESNFALSPPQTPSSYHNPHHHPIPSPVDLEQWRNGFQLNGCVRVSRVYTDSVGETVNKVHTDCWIQTAGAAEIPTELRQILGTHISHTL